MYTKAAANSALLQLYLRHDFDYTILKNHTQIMYRFRVDLQEVGCGHVDWIGLAQDRDRWRTLVSAVMNLRVP